VERPVCKSCPYWRHVEDEEEDGKIWSYGECRRYPKSIPAPHDPKNGTYLGYTWQEWVSWPVTEDDDWCGEHPQSPEYIRSLDITTPDIPADDEIDFSEEGGWTVRERKALRALGITTWSQLAGTTAEELMEQRNMGVMSVGSVIAKVHARGLRLKDERWQVEKYPLAKASEADGQEEPP
jgi:hypothetical protein